MASSVLAVLGALALSKEHQAGWVSHNVTYYEFPKFWTSCGLGTTGKVTNSDTKEFLLSEAMQLNLLYLSALPKGAVTHMKIDWLLELLDFVEFTQAGLPVLDFTALDSFLLNLSDMDMHPVIGFMGNFSNLFAKNPSFNSVIWEELSYQITKRYLSKYHLAVVGGSDLSWSYVQLQWGKVGLYTTTGHGIKRYNINHLNSVVDCGLLILSFVLDMFGAKTVLSWRFETWNKPDDSTYNIHNFTTDEYIMYVHAVKWGLNRAGNRTTNSLRIPLQGPTGEFGEQSQNPLSWAVLKHCNSGVDACPLDVILFDRPGNGTGPFSVVEESRRLLGEIYSRLPHLLQMPVGNDGADPTSAWMDASDFNEDVRYATALVHNVLDHWSAKLNTKELATLATISFDNAFLSYHPYEFSQRTLLAHFRMNQTSPTHSQFIQKPVYAALGLLSRLGSFAADVMRLKTLNGRELRVLKTTSGRKEPGYLSWVILPLDVWETPCGSLNCDDSVVLPTVHLCDREDFAFIIESIDSIQTNPAKVWRNFGRSPYPNATVREELRRQQTLHIQSSGILTEHKVDINYAALGTSWILLLRACSGLNGRLPQVQNVQFTIVVRNEVLLTWKEASSESARCLKTYEVWFRRNNTQPWLEVSSGWHVPFPSFHYAPADGTSVDGFYKLRGKDLFNRTGVFSTQMQYIQI